MPTLVEWQVTSAGWVQVTVDTDRAGSGLLNLAVDDLAATRDELAARGVSTREIQPVNKGVELLPTNDPDGNGITLIGNFRSTTSPGESRPAHRDGCRASNENSDEARPARPADTLSTPPVDP